MSFPDDQAVADYSRANRAVEGASDRFAEPISGASAGSATASGSLLVAARVALLLAGLLGAVALIAADLSTLYEVRVGNVVIGRVIGHHQHDWALLLLGLAALPMLLGALRGALPAMVALAAIGLAATFAGPIGDRSDVGTAGLIGDAYAGASAHATAGYHLETAGAILLLLCGGGLVLLRVRAGWRPRLRLPRRRGAEPTADDAAGGSAEDRAVAQRAGLAPNPYADEDTP